LRTEEDKKAKEGILPFLIYIIYSPDHSTFLPFVEKTQVDEVNRGNERSFFAIAGIRFRWHRNFRVRGGRG